jgi:hypothetical protein
MNRRSFITSGISLIAAPAIIKATNLDYGLLRGYQMDPLVPAWGHNWRSLGIRYYRSSCIPHAINSGLTTAEAMRRVALRNGLIYELKRESELQLL